VNSRRKSPVSPLEHQDLRYLAQYLAVELFVAWLSVLWLVVQSATCPRDCLNSRGKSPVSPLEHLDLGGRPASGCYLALLCETLMS